MGSRPTQSASPSNDGIIADIETVSKCRVNPGMSREGLRGGSNEIKRNAIAMTKDGGLAQNADISCVR